MPDMHLWIEEPISRGGQTTTAATLENLEGRKDTIWFRFLDEFSEYVTSNADPFVTGFIFPLMLHARKADTSVQLNVHGSVSPSLIRNLEEFQLAWMMWRPDLFGRGTIVAATNVEETPEQPNDNAVLCFSGGVDSSFTAFMHSTPGKTSFPFRLGAGVMVQGWEYELDENSLFLRAEKRSNRILASLGIPLIRVATNYRQIVPQWTHSHGAAIAACLSLFQRRFRYGLIAQTMTYQNNYLNAEGINPITDWLFSSDSFQFIPDGAGFSRLDKINTLRKWPEFLQNVRVCWQDELKKSENCCECEKCIRTILQFRVLGLGLPPAFPRDVTRRQIKALSMSRRALVMTFQPILAEARRRRIKGAWVHDLDRSIKRSRRNIEIAALPRWRKIHILAWRKALRILMGK